MRSNKLQQRLRASAVVCELMLTNLLAMMESYNPNGDNLGEVFPEWMVLMVIRINHEAGLPPISCNGITRLLKNATRQQVMRKLKSLLRNHAIKKCGRWGYVGDDSFTEARLDAPYFKRMVEAIRKAADKLKDYDLITVYGAYMYAVYMYATCVAEIL